MSSDTNYWAEPLHPSVVDYGNIVPNHNVYTHLGCVLLRCSLGLGIIWSQYDGNTARKRVLIVLCVLVVIVFGTKHIVYTSLDKVVWKSYLRTVLAYSIAIICLHTNRYDHAGLLIISDALMGLQSRHTAFVASHIMSQKK